MRQHEVKETLAFVLKKPGELALETIPIPRIEGPSELIEMKACGICGSDVRYYLGENPWSLHTMGRSLESPPNIVLGHEVAGVSVSEEGDRRVAVLAFKACGECLYCKTGRENICEAVQHVGHGTGWPVMHYYPGGMSEYFEVWRGLAYDIPDTISFEEGTFLDGLAVAVHAIDMAGIRPGDEVGIIGLGPIGMLAAQVARVKGAADVYACDTHELPIRLSRELGFQNQIQAGSQEFPGFLSERGKKLSAVIDTVGIADTITAGLSALEKSGILVLLAVHAEPIAFPPTLLNGERRIVSSANNRYRDFPEAIELLASGKVKVEPLITHRFPLRDAEKAFKLMIDKEMHEVFKVILQPE